MIIQIYGCSPCIHKFNLGNEDYNVEQLYELSKKEISRKNWELATYYINKITANFNTETIYQDVLIDLIYIRWQEGKSEEALSQISNFQKLYPKHPRTDYLLYLSGIINSNTEKSLLDLIVSKKSLLIKNNKKIMCALQDFNKLIREFPDSKYATQSKKYITMLNNCLSRNELNIAKYYYDNEMFIAAISRARKIAEQTDDPYRKEALDIIGKSYNILNKGYDN